MMNAIISRPRHMKWNKPIANHEID